MLVIKDAIVVEGSVGILQDRVSNLMVVIVNNVIVGDNLRQAAKEIQQDVSDLKT